VPAGRPHLPEPIYAAASAGASSRNAETTTRLSRRAAGVSCVDTRTKFSRRRSTRVDRHALSVCENHVLAKLHIGRSNAEATRRVRRLRCAGLLLHDAQAHRRSSSGLGLPIVVHRRCVPRRPSSSVRLHQSRMRRLVWRTRPVACSCRCRSYTSRRSSPSFSGEPSPYRTPCRRWGAAGSRG